MFFPSLPTSYFLRQLSLPHLPVTVSLTLIFHVQPVAKSQTPGPEPSPPLQRLQPWPWWSRLPRTGPPTLPGPANPHHTRPKPLLSPIILPQGPLPAGPCSLACDLPPPHPQVLSETYRPLHRPLVWSTSLHHAHAQLSMSHTRLLAGSSQLQGLGASLCLPVAPPMFPPSLPPDCEPL